jgi:hypothetical protein
MGRGASKLLKMGRTWPESAKQVEIRLANLRKILLICPPGPECRNPPERDTQAA